MSGTIGEHDLSFATEKFEPAFGSMFREFAMNLAPAIVDAVKVRHQWDIRQYKKLRLLPTNPVIGKKEGKIRNGRPF